MPTNTAKDAAALMTAPATQPEPTPGAGGRYTRLPDGTLVPNPDTTDTLNTPKD